jgi:hypothetical protein
MLKKGRYDLLVHSTVERRLWAEVLRTCEQEQVPVEAVHWASTPAGSPILTELAKRLREEWSSRTVHDPAGGFFTLHIGDDRTDYDSLESQFDDVDIKLRYLSRRDIRECEAVVGRKRIIRCEMICLHRTSDHEEDVAELQRRGLRPAVLSELLAFARAFPDAQKQFPIAALGTYFCGRDYAEAGPAYLDYYGGKRCLRTLEPFPRRIEFFFRLLAVRTLFSVVPRSY